MSGDQPGLLSEDEYGRVVRHGRVLDSPVQVDGYDHDGRRRVAIDLPHGVTPEDLLRSHGWEPGAPLEVGSIWIGFELETDMRAPLARVI